MAGGIAGGMLGGMLFRGMGFAGPGAGMPGGGGGIGFFEILLLAGIGYLIYRYLTRQRSEIAPAVYNQYGQGVPAHYEIEIPAANALDAGLSQIRQRDPAFDERRCGDQIMDLFFKVQGGRMNRDLSALSGLLTAEMTGIFKGDLDRLLRERQVNRLENIAVRSVEISEAWQEAGQDYVTALIYANLLDYTTDEETGSIVSGSRTEPVKFEEYWTVTRPVGNNPWQLSAIGQP
jgi:predicted lipid-binding transport protein (Tim44 family)